MSDFPTADDVARAIVAACRETGDDPIRAASGLVGGAHGTTIRARHYALHALLHTFPKLPRGIAAKLVGAPGNPVTFYHNSWHQVVRPRASASGHMALWWNDAAYARVIDAICGPKKFRLAEHLTTRRQARSDAADVTASIMGDPPRNRSALSQREARE